MRWYLAVNKGYLSLFLVHQVKRFQRLFSSAQKSDCTVSRLREKIELCLRHPRDLLYNSSFPTSCHLLFSHTCVYLGLFNIFFIP